MKIIRKHIIFSGHVQGVGFRWRAAKAAEMYGCTGWVRNDWNGTVSMEILTHCDYFISTDKRLLKYATEEIKMVNPIDFVREWEGEK